jgi:hypothetical protein
MKQYFTYANLNKENNIRVSIKKSGPFDLTEKLKFLYFDPEFYRSSERNTKLIEEKYYWEVTSESLLGVMKFFKLETGSKLVVILWTEKFKTGCKK